MARKPGIKTTAFKAFFLAAAALLSLICIVAFGNTAGSRRYYLLCVILVILACVPFFARFERRRPQAKELVTVAVMCALAIVSRVAFIWLPQMKPSTAIIMITGIALGPETGFLCGAITVLVSNLVFGQGPWTPWQMFAFGMAGLLAGLLYERGLLSRRPFLLACACAALIMLIIGPILDTSTLIFMTSEVTGKAAAAVYLAGIPANAVHAAGTFLTILFVSKPMFEKLDRLKRKYGMMRREP